TGQTLVQVTEMLLGTPSPVPVNPAVIETCPGVSIGSQLAGSMITLCGPTVNTPFQLWVTSLLRKVISTRQTASTLPVLVTITWPTKPTPGPQWTGTV